MQSRGTVGQVGANTVMLFIMQMLEGKAAVMTCTVRLQQGRHGCTYLGAVQLACFPCVPDSCRLRNIEAQSAGANAVTWFPM